MSLVIFFILSRQVVHLNSKQYILHKTAGEKINLRVYFSNQKTYTDCNYVTGICRRAVLITLSKVESKPWGPQL